MPRACALLAGGAAGHWDAKIPAAIAPPCRVILTPQHECQACSGTAQNHINTQQHCHRRGDRSYKPSLHKMRISRK